MTIYMSVDELDTDMHEGVRVAWVGEDGDALAFTADLMAGERAVLAMARRDLGGLCASSEPPQGMWMRFHFPADSDEWQGERCAESDEGAIPVVRVREVSSQREAMLAERARLLREHPEIKGAWELAPLMGDYYGEYWRWIADRWIADRSRAEEAEVPGVG